MVNKNILSLRKTGNQNQIRQNATNTSISGNH